MPEKVNKNSFRSRLRWPAIWMTVAILGITGFQVYWLNNNYDREKQNLDISTLSSFRQTILELQASKLKLERINLQFDSSGKENNPALREFRKNKRPLNRFADRKEPVISIVNLLQEKMRDSLSQDTALRGRPVLTFEGSHIRGVYADSSHINIRTRVRSASLSHQLDSLIDPEMINQIRIEADKNSSAKTITIGYTKRADSGKSQRASSEPEGRKIFIEEDHTAASDGKQDFPVPGKPGSNAVFRFLYDIDSISIRDSVTVKEVTTAYAKRLKEDNTDVEFSVNRLDSIGTDAPNRVTIGFAKPATFELNLHNTFSYMLVKLKLPILFSLLLIGITIFSFVLLYRNMIRQQRLAELKNEFISNITHELKTPIATVGVAIEALKNFNAIDDPQRTREYLDISQNELQRLNLLVDKVLKLSVFEKKELELRKEVFDGKQLVQEVMNTMKIQFEKYHAAANLHIDGDDFLIEADKLHLTSVVYNLLDNALKYSGENPVIDVQLKSDAQYVQISVKDNGIGIPAEYQGKVFDKFFRVPTGNKHNIKGYGLGLSYVSEVVKRHQGFITVSSEPDKGSIFTVKLPHKERG